MKKIFYFLVLAALFIVIVGILTKKVQNSELILKTSSSQENLQEIKFGNTTLAVEIADTQEKRTLGLSGRDKLDENRGMLFLFDGTSAIRSFWMKEMLIPLDFIWISNDKIVQIDKNIPAPALETQDSDLTIYTSKEPVNYVLEVNAGFSDKNNIKVGDSVEIKL